MVSTLFQQMMEELGILKLAVLKLKHHLNFSFQKSIIIERTMQYIKNRTDDLMTILLARKRDVNYTGLTII
jgi:hypothetical protein